MNFKTRIKNLEKIIKSNNRIKYSDLLSPAFIYSGKPFNSYTEMFKVLNIADVPEYLTNADKQIFYDKGLSFYNVAAILKEVDRMI